MQTREILMLGLALAALAAPASAQAPGGDAGRGKTLFQERCGLCHTAAPDDGDGGQGPALAGVVGRKAASVAGFHYTQALTASGRVWTPAALDVFLAAPSKDVPGTNMPVATTSPKDRADLIAYLATVKP
ncbi:MAG: c-type cytochrome [Caulobacteraceae bacterium]